MTDTFSQDRADRKIAHPRRALNLKALQHGGVPQLAASTPATCACGLVTVWLLNCVEAGFAEVAFKCSLCSEVLGFAVSATDREVRR